MAEKIFIREYREAVGRDDLVGRYSVYYPEEEGKSDYFPVYELKNHLVVLHTIITWHSHQTKPIEIIPKRDGVETALNYAYQMAVKTAESRKALSEREVIIIDETIRGRKQSQLEVETNSP